MCEKKANFIILTCCLGCICDAMNPLCERTGHVQSWQLHIRNVWWNTNNILIPDKPHMCTDHPEWDRALFKGCCSAHFLSSLTLSIFALHCQTSAKLSLKIPTATTVGIPEIVGYMVFYHLHSKGYIFTSGLWYSTSTVIESTLIYTISTKSNKI